ncbi:zinc metalloprotease HtpX [Carboxydochorda subterranea]|uniref:Protease HtpX homolog n=1 Tax=Carboxydichorda subterranea TaxID=3109565 RepID=A0ABZ1BYE8_9FIRM|nr:zinc metalloprotease HtpX [Limnochorda sp. L945t]WRP17832.1 zinc metalloprotease HtpX [Limnochorda sp. L945t]
MARPMRVTADAGLTARMILTMVLLAAVYLFFVSVLLAYGVDTGFIVFFVGIMLLVQYYFSDKMVLWSVGAREVSPAEAPELHDIVGRLAALADLPKPRLAIVPTDVPNAFATGRSPSAAVVAVTQGLMRRLSRPELEAVLAHEITHVRNRDVAVITLASFFATVAAFLTRQLMWMGYWGVPMGGGRRDDREGGTNAWIIIYLVSMLVYFVSYILIRALSRYREYAADRGAAYLTGAPSNLASALMKISGVMERIPAQDLRQAEALNAFFIIPAIKGSTIAELFSTHPSLENRLAYLRKLELELAGRR